MEGQNGCLKNSNVAIVMVPFPAQSHLSQLLHLSHLISSSYGISVHYAGSAMHIRQVKLRLHVWDPESSRKIQFHDLQLPHFSSPPPNLDDSLPFPAHLIPVFEASKHLQRPMFELLQQLSTKFKRIVVLHDGLMTSVVQDAKVIPNAEFYGLFATSAIYTFLRIWVDTAIKLFHLDVDFPESILSNEGCAMAPEFENFVDNQFKLMDFQSGSIYNTSKVVEGKYVELLEKLSMNDNLKHFTLGPFTPVLEMKHTRSGNPCIKWLDEQEKHSVIYVSFGSTTSMSDKQIRELALGLEESGQKFIWVLKRADRADIFAEDELIELPEGYEERVKGRGIVVREWAPQLEILAHPSTGGFMSHCGWNSCLESISMGVPIAAWPMHSDQPSNAFLITDELQIGLAVRDWERRSELVTSYTIEHAVRGLMTSKGGDEMRKRAAELGQKLRESVAKGGAARLEMDSFIAHVTR